MENGDFNDWEVNEKKIFGKPVCDSRNVKPGDVFFDLSGNDNGKIYAEDALKRGAGCVVTEKDDVPNSIRAENPRKAFSEYCAEYYSHPERELKFIGVTGTNGKTSVTKIVSYILEYCGFRVAVIGTLGAYINGKRYETGMTTPDSDRLFELLSVAVKNKVDYVVMEVSAHAIFYKKTAGIIFDYLVFTNLSRDHLDFFGDMEHYGNVKKSIFLTDEIKCAVVNCDDFLGKKIISERRGKKIIYSLNGPSDIYAENVKYYEQTELIFKGITDKSAKVPLAGDFNVYNALASVAVTFDILKDAERVLAALRCVPPISGRFNIWQVEGIKLIIDYAHTPDGLEKILKTARGLTKRNIICVFGCGGNRDREKRPIMGRIAANYADLCIITTDNPRYEEPGKIIGEIAGGAKEVSGNCVEIEDREKAIEFAFKSARSGDTLIIAGKGAEDYMEIKGKKYSFSDLEVCERILGRKL